jgi:UDP-3-O-[3-hydroxymyristoyl] N-acetylglucosamine deacetylase
VQRTLKSAVTFTGRGLHTGAAVRVTVRPASAEYGIWFQRTDIADRDAFIPALWDAVIPSQLCTRVANPAGVSVSTVEHLMAAIAGTGLNNLLIEVDGPEVPILDGSAAPFVAGFLGRGIQVQGAPVRAFEILDRVEVRNGPAAAVLEPAASFEMAFDIDFADIAIGRQAKTIDLANGAFVRELSDSRTFCRRIDVEMMKARGLIAGGSYDNAVVVDGARVLSPGGFRHPDEAVRHKMLDAVGDLALAGAPILGRFIGERSGHALTNALLRALFARPESYRMVVCDIATSARLPGVGLRSSDRVLLSRAA